MKIAICVPSLRAGGAERVVSLLAGKWSTTHSVSILTGVGPGEAPFYELSDEIKVVNLDFERPSRSILSAVLNNMKRIGVLRHAILDFKPDLVISFTVSMNVLALIAMRGRGCPVIISERLVPYAFPDESPFWKRARLSKYHRASALVVQTEAVRRWANAQWPDLPTHVIPNPVMPFNGIGAPHIERRPVILSVGRLSAEKGHRDLILAFNLIASEFPEWSLRLVGDGPDRDALESLANSFPEPICSRIEFAGRKQDVGAEYASAGVFVLPSLSEGFPNALLEAMSAGLPCIATDCPEGPREIIQEPVNGLLATPNSPESLAEKLRNLLSDQDLRSRLSEASQAVAATYDLTVIAKIWDDLFEKVVVGGKQQREESR